MKKKVLLISDSMLHTSGVGLQSKYLAMGLAATGKYQIMQLGSAIYVPPEARGLMNVAPDIHVLNMEGFSNLPLFRKTLIDYKPDVCIMFQDPRFFEPTILPMHDEIQQVCPLMYWHLWDNCDFTPDFNMPMYNLVDHFNCINYDTYQFVKSIRNDAATYIPHAIPEQLYYPLPESTIAELKKAALPGREDHFILLYVNRSAHRKRTTDVLLAFKKFIDKNVTKEKRRPKATLLMHVDPNDSAGAPLLEVVRKLGIEQYVVFDAKISEEHEMNALYNIADCTINISYAEGFGLGTLNGLFTGTPMIANRTGGLKRQVRNPYTKFVHGIELEPDQMLVGSIGKPGQSCPYIGQDMARMPDIVDAIQRMYKMPSSQRKMLGMKGREYALKEYSIQQMITQWDKTIEQAHNRWKSEKKAWGFETL